MHKDRVLDLADKIERLESNEALRLGFNMATYAETEVDDDGWFSETPADRKPANCGAVCCIAGWAVALYGGVQDPEDLTHADMFDEGAELLSLSRSDARRLFLPERIPVPRSAITPADAALTLRKLAKESWVDWSHVRGPDLSRDGSDRQ